MEVPLARDTGALRCRFPGNGSLCCREVPEWLTKEMILVREGGESFENDPETLMRASS